jgi:hypothetical protein
MTRKKKSKSKKDVDESFTIDASKLLADAPVENDKEDNIDNSTIENVMALKDINLNVK